MATTVNVLVYNRVKFRLIYNIFSVKYFVMISTSRFSGTKPHFLLYLKNFNYIQSFIQSNLCHAVADD